MVYTCIICNVTQFKFYSVADIYIYIKIAGIKYIYNLLLWHIIYILLIVHYFLGFNCSGEEMFCCLKNNMAQFYNF